MYIGGSHILWKFRKTNLSRSSLKRDSHELKLKVGAYYCFREVSTPRRRRRRRGGDERLVPRWGTTLSRFQTVPNDDPWGPFFKPRIFETFYTKQLRRLSLFQTLFCSRDFLELNPIQKSLWDSFLLGISCTTFAPNNFSKWSLIMIPELFWSTIDIFESLFPVRTLSELCARTESTKEEPESFAPKDFPRIFQQREKEEDSPDTWHFARVSLGVSFNFTRVHGRASTWTEVHRSLQGEDTRGKKACCPRIYFSPCARLFFLFFKQRFFSSLAPSGSPVDF